MNVLFAASECAPVVKVGGLGDVVGSLPIALDQIDINCAVVIPAYKPLIDSQATLFTNRLLHTEVKFGEKAEPVNVFKTVIPKTKIPLYLIQNDTYLSNGGIYFDATAFVTSQGEIDRFAFFSKALAQVFLDEPGCDFKPDVIHCHDWHTGFVPKLVADIVPTVFTIHNLANQGFSSVDVAQKLGLDINKSKILSWDALDSNLDFIMQGILNATFITTVSPTYAREILTPIFGEGLHEVLEAREGRLYGILNGIDCSVWNPEKDPYIKPNFNLKSLDKKQECKVALQTALDLPSTPKKPILAVVSRLTTQKGIDMIISLMDEILGLGCQLVVLGTGDPSLENKLRIKEAELAKEGLFEARVLLEYNEELAHKIYAGSDIFLVPSRFEPCGLTQMIAMRYGTIPLVRQVGGLADSVVSGKTGFSFVNFNDSEFLDALKRALNYYSYKDEWRKLVTNAMEQDFSWAESAKKYADIYQLALDE
ncbi:MAG: glycogen synthase [Patescibacteria group bacterium]